MNTNWLDYTLLTLVIMAYKNYLCTCGNWGIISDQLVRKNPFCRRILITECMFRKHSVIMNYAVWIRDLSIPHNS